MASNFSSTSPKIVNYVPWNVVLKCKNMCQEEAFKSIWQEEYINSPDFYNKNDMIIILKNNLDELYNDSQKANFCDRFFSFFTFNKTFDEVNTDSMLSFLYTEYQMLQVRDSSRLYLVNDKDWKDLYLIKKDGKYYTIDEYDKNFKVVKENN